MSYAKIWVHAVWGTKHREPVLTRDIRPALFRHIHEQARSKGIYLDFINGYVEHAHCLFTLNADTSLSKTIQLLKGESAHWANKQGLVKPKLQWADDYFAVSVSESIVEKVRDYIRNQEEHHSKKTFTEECEEFMTRYGFTQHHDGKVTAKAGEGAGVSPRDPSDKSEG